MMLAALMTSTAAMDAANIVFVAAPGGEGSIWATAYDPIIHVWNGDGYETDWDDRPQMISTGKHANGSNYFYYHDVTSFTNVIVTNTTKDYNRCEFQGFSDFNILNIGADGNRSSIENPKKYIRGTLDGANWTDEELRADGQILRTPELTMPQSGSVVYGFKFEINDGTEIAWFPAAADLGADGQSAKFGPSDDNKSINLPAGTKYWLALDPATQLVTLHVVGGGTVVDPNPGTDPDPINPDDPDDLTFDTPKVADMLASYYVGAFNKDGHILWVATSHEDGLFSWAKYEDQSSYTEEMSSASDNSVVESNYGLTHECKNYTPAYYRVYMEHEVSPLKARQKVTAANRKYEARVARTIPMDLRSFSTGIDEIVGDVDNVDAPEVYYNLQGQRVANPSNGVFIRVKGTRSEKVLVK